MASCLMGLVVQEEGLQVPEGAAAGMALFVALAAASLISCVAWGAAGGCGTETIGAADVFGGEKYFLKYAVLKEKMVWKKRGSNPKTKILFQVQSATRGDSIEGTMSVTSHRPQIRGRKSSPPTPSTTPPPIPADNP